MPYQIDIDLVAALRQRADAEVLKGDDALVAVLRQAADRIVKLNAQLDKNHPPFVGAG